MKRGTVVISKAGRDKGKLLVVLNSEEQYVTLSDGKKRPLTNPKKKKLKHIAVTKYILDEESLITNKKIFIALRTHLSEVI